MPLHLRFLRRLLTVWLLLATTLGAIAQSYPSGLGLPTVDLAAPALPATPPTIPGQLVFRLKPQFQPAAAAATPTVPALTVALQSLGATGLRPKFPHSRPPALARQAGSIDLRLLYQITVPATVSLAKARALLLSTGAIEYVEPLYIRQSQYQPNDPGADSTATNNQYYLKSIRAYRAWDIFKGDSTLVIGLTDGGARFSHQEFRKQIKRNYADKIDGIDNDKDGYIDNFQGWDLANNDNDASYSPFASNAALVHGSQVAGVMCAEPDNGVGIAGAGFNCRFLPLNIYPNTPTGAFAGYEAIVYAADHGCRVINMSWGGPGGYSQFEQDVISYAAVTRDVVLVAAAGNTNAELLFYPASYEHVISVSGVDAKDTKTSATYSRRVDLTAPGTNMLTTYGYEKVNGNGPVDADYQRVGGTSFSAPLVSAAAALVRGKFPQYTAAQVKAQLRQTADNVDALPGNLVYAGLIGTGRLNMARALSQTDRREARVVRSRFAPARNAYALGEEIQLTIKALNLLRPLENVSIMLTSLTPYLTVNQGEFAVGNLATLDSSQVQTIPFRLTVAAQNVPLNTIATLRYRIMAANGYQSDDFITLKLNPDYVTLDAGDLALSLTSRGNLGYDDVSATFGEGASYKRGTPLLSEGGLLLATSPTRVSDRLRGAPRGTVRKSFFSLSQARRALSGPRANQEAFILFQDSLPALNRNLSLGVRVRLRGLSWAATPRRDFVLLEYTLKNISSEPINPLLAGLVMDWDLPGEAARNAAAWDAVRQMGYCYDVGTPRQYAGVQLLRGGEPTTYAINNNAPAGTPVRFADGFSKAEKYLTLSSGTATSTAGLPNGADVTQVVGAYVGLVAPGDSAVVIFAVLAAGSLPALQAAADAAQAAYAQILPTRAATATSGAWHVYPNPTTGLVHIEVPATFGAKSAQVTDILGRLMLQRAVSGPTFDLNLQGMPPGTYTVRVTGTDQQVVSRLISVH